MSHSLGEKVSFTKFGAVQNGTISGVRRIQEVETTETLEGGEQPQTVTREKVKYRVDYQLKNGNEVREWLTGGALERMQG